MRTTVDVSVSCPLWSELGFDAVQRAHDIVVQAFDAAEKPAAIGAREVEVSVVLSDDMSVQILNNDYRGKNKPTNVLSFAALDDEDDAASDVPDMPCALGDIVIAYETVASEAASMDVSFLDHYTHLLIHGTLHLMGYDHEQEDEANTMESLEILLLSRLGIENPYAHPNFMA
jgi:probable rRNA maturation factor